MYEAVTYESILRRMLEKVPNTIDKREGSIIYDALAPAAAELQNMYIELDVILNESFADTQSREYLIRRAAERGIVPTPATHAIWKGEFNLDVSTGTRFSLDNLHYTVIEKIDQTLFKLQCETAGKVGNTLAGDLIPVNYIEGLTHAALVELLIPGEDEEGTEHLRQRYFSNLDSKAFGGNVQDYKEKTEAIPGVGGVKVYPAWNGGGTVKLVFINSDYKAPGTELISLVQEQVDPEANQGEGLGFAPIGHVVTVEGVAETEVSISTNITYQEDWIWEAVKPYAEKTVDEYFAELSQSWAESDPLIVRISQIESRLLNLPGVIDIRGTAINCAEQNLILGANCIPKRGELVG